MLQNRGVLSLVRFFDLLSLMWPVGGGLLTLELGEGGGSCPSWPSQDLGSLDLRFSFFEVSLGSVVACFFPCPASATLLTDPHGDPPPQSLSTAQTPSFAPLPDAVDTHPSRAPCVTRSRPPRAITAFNFLYKKMHLFPILWRRFPLFILSIKSNPKLPLCQTYCGVIFLLLIFTSKSNPRPLRNS